jgi:hypothetical protein
MPENLRFPRHPLPRKPFTMDSSQPTTAPPVAKGDVIASIAKASTQLDALEKTCKEKGLNFDHWLQKLYDRKSERFLQDNERIWRTGAIFIPASVAGLTVVPTAMEKAPFVVVPVGLVSIGIMYLWIAIAEHHRDFQTTHHAWIDAIQVKLGISDPPPSKTRTSSGLRSRLFPATVQAARKRLAALVYWIWALLIVVAVVAQVRAILHEEANTQTAETKPAAAHR